MTIERDIHTGKRLDRSSFEQVFRHYFPSLMLFARRFLRDEDDAREVVHRVFINLWERREELDTRKSLKSYLFTAVHNRSLNFLRDRKKFSPEEVPERGTDTDVSTYLESMELEERIEQAVAGLPEKCREIFVLNRFEGLRYGEIAQKLGISVKTVENQMSKALKVLREKLIDYLTVILWLVLFTLN